MLGATYSMQRRITKAQQNYADQLGVEVALVKKRSKEKRNRKIPAYIRKAVLNRDDHSCSRCGQKSQLTIDHIFLFLRVEAMNLKTSGCFVKAATSLNQMRSFEITWQITETYL